LLVNASPDLPQQIEACGALQPSPDCLRNSPIQGVVVTNADLDHVLGIFSLREGAPLTLHGTGGVRQVLEKNLGMRGVLAAFCGVRWLEPPSREFGAIAVTSGRLSGISFRAIALPTRPPPFAREDPPAGEHSIACQFRDEGTGGRLLVAPDVGVVTEELSAALAESDAVLFDGTFWSGAELSAIKPGAPAAAEMGHVAIRDGSLELLSKLSARIKVYIHLNNTNPVLDPRSVERAALDAAGIQVGLDGMEFEI
jgi:pyrroloquinoline quinone biosynthesis protein B